MFGVQEEAAQLTVTKITAAESRRSVVRFEQRHQGIPIIGGELIVHLDNARNVLTVAGKALSKIDVGTTPTIDAALAAQTAIEVVSQTYRLSATELTTTAPALSIYDPMMIGAEPGSTALVWRMDVVPRTLLPIRELVLIDAQRGSVTLHFNQVDTALNRRTYTAGNSTTLPGTLVCDESNPSCNGDVHAAAAHLHAADTYTIYLNNHGRDGIDSAGMPIRSTVHYGSAYINAFWNGPQVAFGDGAGFPLADDVVAHELTHGVTQYTSNLFYYRQSGAINESLSDVWGELVDQANGRGNDDPDVRWLLGEDIAGLGAIRSMGDPPAFSDPDRMTSPLYSQADSDNGGVHTTGGVNNKAASLMVDGGTFNGQTITGSRQKKKKKKKNSCGNT